MKRCPMCDSLISSNLRIPDLCLSTANIDIDGGVYVNVATHNTKPLTELQIRSAVYGCSDGKCLCGKCGAARIEQ